MGQFEVDALVLEQISEPVPAGCRLDDGAVVSGLGYEVGVEGLAVVVELLLFDDLAVVVDGGDEAVALDALSALNATSAGVFCRWFGSLLAVSNSRCTQPVLRISPRQALQKARAGGAGPQGLLL